MPKISFYTFLPIIIIIIRCSGMFRNVPGCSMFLVLSTAVPKSTHAHGFIMLPPRVSLGWLVGNYANVTQFAASVMAIEWKQPDKNMMFGSPGFPFILIISYIRNLVPLILDWYRRKNVFKLIMQMQTLTARALRGGCELNTNKQKIFNVVSTAQKSSFIQNKSYLSIIILGLDFFGFILRLFGDNKETWHF